MIKIAKSLIKFFLVFIVDVIEKSSSGKNILFSVLFTLRFHLLLIKMKIFNKKYSSLGGIKFHFNNFRETKVILREIFFEECYKLPLGNVPKRIIDGGANIGLATLYFKSVYPNAEVLAFEPNEYAHNFLIKNLKANQISGVKVFKAALSGHSGKLKFNVCPDELMASTATNRLKIREVESNEMLVDAVILSDYLDQRVDILKLDIEGAESGVLAEVEHKLNRVKYLFLEMHYTQGDDSNDIGLIFQILQKHGFEYHVRSSSSGGNDRFSPFKKIEPISSFLIFARNINFKVEKD